MASKESEERSMRENQRPAKRKGEEEATAGSMEEEDKISQLPEPILEHVISFLGPQDDAVRTCVLSKSWRHLGPTRPKIEFHESHFRRRGSEEKFISVVENTLQRYVDQKLPIQEFILGTSWRRADDPKSFKLLNKWIPVVVMNNKGLKTFVLNTHRFSLPSVVVQALGELKFLRTLSLGFVWIEDKNLEKIMSSCPSIQRLVLDSCRGLSSVKVNMARNLKHLDCHQINYASIEIDGDDAPSLETIRISHCRLQNNCFFLQRLESLYLFFVHVPPESLHNLSSNNCPCLQDLELQFCSGFSEIKLSNRSIKRLIINSPFSAIEVAVIDAANMLYFEFRSKFFPSIASFATTSRECKSHVERSMDSKADVSSTWLLKLHGFLKALSHSQISLEISHSFFTSQDNTYDGRVCEPVVVHHLCLYKYCSSLLNCLFRICRPRYIGPCKVLSQLEESFWQTLVNKGETRQCHFWQQDLEETSIQVLDENTNEWRDVQQCALSSNQTIRLRLKWRDFS